MRARFHLDAPGWFGEAEQPAYLQQVAGAVWHQQAVRIRYQSWKAQKRRRVEPIGVILKGGAWYLAGRVDESIRTYRISRILDIEVLDERFERPLGFDLAGYWKGTTERLEAELHPNLATVRISPPGLQMLQAFSSPYVRARLTIGSSTDAQGWLTATVPVGSVRQAAVEFLRLGAEVEVLEPPELRSKIAAIACALRQLYPHDH
jgi:predicted DNA-binding transcriptional regulator YafY